MSGQQLEQRTPEQTLISSIRSPVFKDQVAMALPPTVTPERFVRVATTAIMTNPDIAKLDHNSVLRAMVQSAAMGLIPDGKQAAITPRKGQAVLVPMIQGYRDIAAEHGWTLRTAVVYANDAFDHAVIDGEEMIFHRPVRPGEERGELIAAYAIAKHRDGRRMQVVLHPDDVAKRRASASTQNVWNEHPAAMWEKSAGRDLFAQLGLAELDERVQRVLAASQTEPAEAARLIYGPAATESAGAQLAADVAPNPDATASPPSAQVEHPTTGVVDQQAPAAGPESPAAAGAPGREPEPSLADDTPFQAPAAVEDDPAVAAARAAAQYLIPNGAHKGLALGEVHAKGDKGETWLRWALGNVENPADYRDAIWSFCRVFAPELYEAAIAKQESQSA